MTRRRAPILIWILLSVSSLSTACDDKKASVCEAFKPQWAPKPTKTNPALAHVNGVPLLKSQLKRYLLERREACDSKKQSNGLKHSPKTCVLSKREALNELIDMELLAQEARRRGYFDEGAIRTAKNKAAHLVLQREFESKHGIKDIPIQHLKRAYELNKRHFVRPELRRFSHVLLRLKRPKGQSSKISNADLKREAKTQTLAEKFHKEAQKIAAKKHLDKKTILEMASKWRKEAKQKGFTLLAETGTKTQSQLVGNFAKVLFSLTPAHALSELVQTRFGIHIIFLQKILPAKNVSFEKAKDTIAKREFLRYRKKEFKAFIKKIKKKCRVKFFLENLSATRRKCHPTPRRKNGVDKNLSLIPENMPQNSRRSNGL